MPLVRTKFRETPFEMTGEEAEALRKQGLVVEPEFPAASPDTPDGGSAPKGSDAPKTPAKPKETK